MKKKTKKKKIVKKRNPLIEDMPTVINVAKTKGHKPFKYGVELKLMAQAMRDQGMGRKEISEKLGVSTSTVHAFFSEMSGLDDITHADLAQKFRNRLSSQMILDSKFLFDSATDEEKVAKASTLQLVTAGSILIDKSRLLAGESTENIAVRVKHVNDTDAELLAIREEIRQLESEAVKQSNSLDVEHEEVEDSEEVSQLDYEEVQFM